LATHQASIRSTCFSARLPTRSFTLGSQACDEREAVHVVATLHVGVAFFDRLEQPRALLGVEVLVSGEQPFG
jgi:hypothetical protein